MRKHWIDVPTLLVLAVLLVTSCARAKTSPPAPDGVVPQATGKVGESQPSVPGPEVLVPGTADTVLSSLEPDKAVNVEFILDASGSMLERVDGKPKVEIAKEVIGNLAQELPSSLNLGLRVYGHRYPEADKARSCQDIQLLTPLGQGNGKSLAQQLQGVQANGWTPMAMALELAAQDLPALGQSLNNVVLLSDGQETCGGQPAEVAQRLKEGSAGLTVHTIGFAINEETRKELQEIARVSGGSYNEAQDAQGLLQAMQRALLAARSGTFLRVEVLGEGGRRVSASTWLQDPQTGDKLHEFRSWIDSPVAPGVYGILVGTAPRVVYRQLPVQAHTRTILRLGTGDLRVELADVQGQPLKALAHLQDPATGSTLRSFPTWYNQPVLPGNYDLVIEANPTLVRRNISVSPQKLTLINLGRGTLRLDLTTLGGGRPNWEAELRDSDTDQVLYRSLAGREQALMAGSYRLTILSVPPILAEVQIAPGETKVIKLETGLLRVELMDSSGQRSTAPASLISDSQGEIGDFYTWQDAFPLPGSYQLTVHTHPEIHRQIQVSASEPTILKLRSP